VLSAEYVSNYRTVQRVNFVYQLSLKFLSLNKQVQEQTRFSTCHMQMHFRL
jgi:hypothetical protein